MTSGAAKCAALLVAVVAWLGGGTPARAQDRTHVLFTVDVESYANGSPEGQIWGRVGTAGEEYGIARMMDILDSYDAKATFYVNVYESAKFGEEALGRVLVAIASRGHDVQLHTHPALRYEIGSLSRGTPEQQREIIGWGMDFIEQWTGVRVIAHRAGGFRANLNTVAAARELGLKVDSSLAPVFADRALAREVGAVNRPFMLNGILEIPATYYVQARLGAWQSRRVLDIEGSTLAELIAVIEQARDARVPAVNVMMHSFSFVRAGRPDHAVEQRFRALLAHLSADDRIAVSSTSEFFAHWGAALAARAGREEFSAYTGWRLTYLRALQDYDRGWANLMIAAAPLLAPLALCGALLGWRAVRRRIARAR